MSFNCKICQWTGTIFFFAIDVNNLWEISHANLDHDNWLDIFETKFNSQTTTVACILLENDITLSFTRFQVLAFLKENLYFNYVPLISPFKFLQMGLV